MKRSGPRPAFLWSGLALSLLGAGVAAYTAHASASARRTAAKAAGDSHPRTENPGNSATQRLRAAEAFGRLPLSFEENRGQFDGQVRFAARQWGAELFLTASGATLMLRQSDADGRRERAPGVRGTPPAAPKFRALRMQVLGANPETHLSGLEELPGQTNYFHGREPAGWRTGIRNYREVRYHQIYPGIDLVFHGQRGQLEYDLELSGDADVGQIRLSFEGADRLRVDGRGDLWIDIAGSSLKQPAPVITREHDDRREAVAGGYVLLGPTTVGFQISGQRAHEPLLIDPILSYSTYLGGTDGVGDEGTSIAIDSAGSIYLVGRTNATDFPTKGAIQGNLIGTFDVFLSKINAAGSALVYSTYLGGNQGTGSNFDYSSGSGIAVDGAGNAFIAGGSGATDFPVTAGAFQTQLLDDESAFVAKLDPSGSQLVYSSFLGGGSGALGIAIDSAGDAFVVGATSQNFPVTTGAFQTTFGGQLDAFVAEFNPSGSGLIFATFLGGGQQDEAFAVAVDGPGSIYVTGSAQSLSANPPFPTKNPFQPSGLAFVTKLDPGGQTLAYSSLFGGSQNSPDQGAGIAVDGSGSAYITGVTQSQNFRTTTGAYLVHYPGTNTDSNEAFLVKVKPDGSGLAYATYLGAIDQGNAAGTGVAVDSAGDAFVVGTTTSPNFPTYLPLASTGPPQNGDTIGFVSEFNPSGSALLFSSFLGETALDSVAVAVDDAGATYLTGSVYSEATNFPTVNPLQAQLGNPSGNAFVMKLVPAPPATVTGISPATGSTLGGTSVSVSGTGFLSATTFSLGGVEASSVTFVSATQLTGKTPAHPLGPVDLAVTNPGLAPVVLASAFTYVPLADGGMGADGGPVSDGGTPSDAGATTGGDSTPSGCSCGATHSPLEASVLLCFGASLWLLSRKRTAIARR